MPAPEPLEGPDPRQRDIALIQALAGAIEARAARHHDHSSRVARRSMAVLRALTTDEPDEDLVYGFLLHDVGLVGVPDAILLKAGALEPEETAQMRTHVATGADLIKPLRFSRAAIEVIRTHHERFDGQGYPAGLAGDRIPLSARVFSVVDAYDSMTTNRPHRRAMDHDCAIAELRRKAGSQFDPVCVDAFRAMQRELGLVGRATSSR